MAYVMSSAESQKGVNAVRRHVPLRTRKALSLSTLYSDSALLVLKGTSLNNALTPFWLSADDV